MLEVIPINTNGNTSLKATFWVYQLHTVQASGLSHKDWTSEIRFYLASYPCCMFAFCNADVRWLSSFSRMDPDSASWWNNSKEMSSSVQIHWTNYVKLPWKHRNIHNPSSVTIWFLSASIERSSSLHSPSRLLNCPEYSFLKRDWYSGLEIQYKFPR